MLAGPHAQRRKGFTTEDTESTEKDLLRCAKDEVPGLTPLCPLWLICFLSDGPHAKRRLSLDEISGVTPAKAGAHNHRPLEYGPRLSPG
jgi:hypothetical protein